MPEEELIKSLKEKKTESLFRRIKPNWIVAGIFGTIVFLWMYSNSTQLQEFFRANAMIILLSVGVLFYVFMKSREPESVIGLIQSQEIAEKFIYYQQRKGTIPQGEVTIEQDKRRHIGDNPRSYYHVAEVKTPTGTKTYIIGVDSKTGDITLREPKIGGITSISEEMKDIIPERKVITAEEEIEEG